MQTAWIGMGANLGDRAGTLAAAFEMLRGLPGVSDAALSPLYETEPIGPPQPAYLNACSRLWFEGGAPQAWLERLMGIEARFGRRREVHWGPRTLDLDLLMVDGMVLDEPGLILPHPRLHERAFVLRPLLDLDPGLVHPVLGPLSGCLACLGSGGIRPYLLASAARG